MANTAHDIKDFADQFAIALMPDAQAALPAALRDLHRAILSAFIDPSADTSADPSAAPTTAWIADRARELRMDPEQALAHLDRVDLIHTAAGSVTVAYPFSGVPTPHRVRLHDGPHVWAMCAGDALGIPLMTGRNATITSTDQHTGEAIRIRYQDGNWDWQPQSTVMLVAGTSGCVTAADTACRNVHFFTDADNARAYLRADPALAGQVYDQASSIEAGRVLFGSLLGR